MPYIILSADKTSKQWSSAGSLAGTRSTIRYGSRGAFKQLLSIFITWRWGRRISRFSLLWSESGGTRWNQDKKHPTVSSRQKGIYALAGVTHERSSKHPNTAENPAAKKNRQPSLLATRMKLFIRSLTNTQWPLGRSWDSVALHVKPESSATSEAKCFTVNAGKDFSFQLHKLLSRITTDLSNHRHFDLCHRQSQRIGTSRPPYLILAPRSSLAFGTVFIWLVAPCGISPLLAERKTFPLIPQKPSPLHPHGLQAPRSKDMLTYYALNKSLWLLVPLSHSLYRARERRT